MKKLSVIICSGIILLTGCAKDETGRTAVEKGGQVTVSFTANLSQDTKAAIDSDGNGAYADQCRLQVIMKNGTKETLVYDSTMTVDVTTHKTSFNDINLVRNQTYDFMFWADNKDGAYYTTTDLKAVTINGTYVGGADARDAFFASLKDRKITEAFDTAFNLYRPFAQLNIITTDIDEIYSQLPSGDRLSDVAPNKVALTFTAPDTFNVLTGEASGSREFTYETAVYTNPYKTEPESQNTLSMDYIYAPATQGSVCDIKFTAKNDTQTGMMADISTTFNNIPFQRNYRTNIIGELLTNASTFTVTVQPGWTTPEINK